MEIKLIFLAILFLFIPGNRCITSVYDSTWPKVREVSQNETENPSCIGLSPSFSISYEDEDSLTNYIVDRTKTFLDTLTTDENGIDSLNIEFLTTHRYFKFDLYDGEINNYTQNVKYEYYEIEFNFQTIDIRVFHILGLIRSLQTLEQIIYNAVNNAEYTLCDIDSKIVDYPRYRYRGIMLDTARNFYTVDKLKEILRNMYLARYTVFHWHLTDSQSLPFSSSVYTDLKNGAFEGENKYYTKQDITELRTIAFLYGIEIIIEIDLPGHSWSFTVGYPSLLPIPQNDCQSVSTGCDSRTHPCSMTLPETDLLFNIVDNLIEETSDEEKNLASFLGLGMDEFAVYCWENDPIYVDKFDGYCEGMYDNLLFDFATRYIDLVKTHDLKRIAYDDIYLVFPNEGGGANDVCATTKVFSNDSLIFLVWGGSSYWLSVSEKRPHEVINEATGDGYEVIVGNYERWYFGSCASRITSGDQGYYRGLFPDEGLSTICGDKWKRYWMYDPTDGIDEENQDKILGGEGLLWETEESVALGALGFESGYASDGHHGYFIGERLWSEKSERTELLRLEAKNRIELLVKDFRADRLAELDDTLEQNGVSAFGQVKNVQKYWDRPDDWTKADDHNDDDDGGDSGCGDDCESDNSFGVVCWEISFLAVVLSLVV